MINVAILDDSQIYIEGVKAILAKEDDIEVSVAFSSPVSLISYLESCSQLPDILLLDISIEEDDDGLVVASSVTKAYPSIGIIILSHYKRVDYIISALQSKVRGYIAKDTSPSELAKSIRLIYQGKGLYFGDTISFDTLIKAFGSAQNIKKAKPYSLTKIELSVLKYLSIGCSVKEIASILKTSPNTVESHKEHIRDKMGFDTIIEAIVFAVKCGVI